MSISIGFRLLPIALTLVTLAPATPARANGAFPSTGQIMVRRDRPQAIIVGTTFGLLLSGDAGSTWQWTCEHGESNGAFRYAISSDDRRVIGISGNQLVVTEDGGCTWKGVGRQLGAVPLDYFPHPADPAQALAIVEFIETQEQSLIRLDLRRDTGDPAVVYTAPPDGALSTVELARSNPEVIYATLRPRIGEGSTQVLRSPDDGQTWSAAAPTGAPEYSNLRLAAVDPERPNTLYLRAGRALKQGEALLVSDDGGLTVVASFSTMGALTALLRLENGDVLLAEETSTGGRLYRSRSGGHDFVEESAAHLHFRALAERGSRLYAAVDPALDGYAVAVSEDRGVTWQHMMAFADVASMAGCGGLAAVCRDVCAQLAGVGTFPPAICSAPPPATDVETEADAGDPPSPEAGGGGESAGCACGLARPETASGWGLLVAVLASWLRGRRRLRPGAADR